MSPPLPRPAPPSRPFPHRGNTRAVALVIVLAFVVLLTGLTVAFFSSSLLYRQISNSSASEAKVDLFAQGAVDTIVGDLKQEITAGSKATRYTDGSGKVVAQVYLPANPYAAVPALALKGSQSNVTSFAPNLVKRSAYQQNFFPAGADTGAGNYTGGTTLTVPLPLAATASASTAVVVTPSNRAANLPSTTPSQNGRLISVARWNKALLLPKAASNQSSDTDLTPDATQFVPPDWVLVDRTGANPTAVSTAVVGRYAYAIYDEGGLLDANVAGYPLGGTNQFGVPVTSAQYSAAVARKNALAFADLKQLPGISALAPARQTAVINSLVGWRNIATAKPTTGTLEGANYNFPATSLVNFSTAMLTNTNGFLRTSNLALYNGQTDRVFASRQELMRLMLNAIATPGSDRANVQIALQCLGTFSRDVLQPSFAPASGRPTVLSVAQGGNSAGQGAPGVTPPLDDQINPSFLNVRVTNTKTGGRNDGTDLTQGDPLVKKRFNLNRLAWVTWEGPSSQASAATKTALLNAGITQAMIDAGTAANIQAYFGLTWSSGVWKYNVHNGGASGKGSIMRVGRPLNVTAVDPTTYVQDAGREPDFFELLKAAISVGSLGKAITTNNSTAVTPNGYAASQVPTNYRYSRDTSVDYQVIQIGANIIDQFDPDSLPTRIVFDDGSQPAQEFDGVENLPYLSNFINGMLRVEAPGSTPSGYSDGTNQWGTPGTAPMMGSPGAGVVMLVPALWNPHDVNGSLGNPRPANFRIVADSTDPITAAAADQSGGSTTGYNKVYTSAVGHMSDGNSTFAYSSTNPSAQPTNASYPIDYTTTGRVLNKLNAALTFSDSNGVAFREPTFLLRNGGTINLQNPARSGGIVGIDVNPVASATDAAGTAFCGFVLGTFPLSFEALDSDRMTKKVIYTGAGFVGPGGVTSQPLVYLTYRVQYEYPIGSGTYITYDTKYGRAFSGRVDFNWNLGTRTDVPTISQGPDQNIPWNWSSTVDPRSARFGLFFGAMSIHESNPTPYQPGGPNGWIDSTKAIALSLRPDNYGGHYFVDFTQSNPSINTTDDPMADMPFPQFAAGWTQSVVHGYNGSNVPDFNPGMLSQNNSSEPFLIRRYATDAPSGNDEFGKVTGNPQPTYYADPDGVVRRAMGAFVPVGASTTSGESQAAFASGASPIGLPIAITQAASTVSTAIVTNPAASLNQAQSRPLILNRPFQSAAELGYVFRDTPWKTLDLFTPESGDDALLDVFCVGDTDNTQSLVAGRVGLNTKQPLVLASIVSGAVVDDPKLTDATVGSLSPTVAPRVANALTARTGDLTTSGMGPMRNVAELIGRWVSAQAIVPSASYVPANPNGDLALSNGYKDGKLSYAGFSGSPAATSPAKDLGSAYQNATFSSTALQTSVTQVERLRTAPLRALANVGQTRVWNLMIDVVAQTGRYPASATALAGFAVEGEQRYWIHLAIDRLTGQVIDKQVEVVKE